jgi:quinoprotein relay system zinc metallohydrolase 1
MRPLVLLALLLALAAPAGAADYKLTPVLVGADSYVFLGDTHFFNPSNGGNIVNTGFIVTPAGVVVIDTGPSAGYGQAMRQAIRAVTPKPVVKVIITHAHPDHFLGSQAFTEAPIVSGAGTVEMIRAHGAELAGNLYTLVGDAMRGTEPVVPQVTDSTGETIGGHELQYLHLSGHTGDDMAVFDRTTGVLFTGDLVFFRRALTVPNADLPQWRKSLAVLAALPYRQMVPGHGPIPRGGEAIAETRAYMDWLDQTLSDAVEGGLDMTEAFHIRVPERFRKLAIVDEEFQRSVEQSYPRLEGARLPALN